MWMVGKVQRIPGLIDDIVEPASLRVEVDCIESQF